MTSIGITLDSAAVNEASVATFARSGASFIRFIAKGMAPRLYLSLAESFLDCGRSIRSSFDVLVDLPGKRPRMAATFSEISLFRGMTVLLVDEDAPGQEIRSNLVFPTVNLLIYRDVIRQGDRLLISDGMTELKVLEILPSGILAEATRAESLLTPNRSILLPDTNLHYRSLSDADLEVAEAIAGVPRLAESSVALSMVESAEPIHEIRRILPDARIVAKIETRHGLVNRAEIVNAADVVMLARGDLSLSLGVNLMPAAIDLLLNECQRQDVEVMLATGIFDGVCFQERPSIADLTDLWYYWSRGIRTFLLSGGVPSKYGRDSLRFLEGALSDFRFASEDLASRSV